MTEAAKTIDKPAKQNSHPIGQDFSTVITSTSAFKNVTEKID